MAIDLLVVCAGIGFVVLLSQEQISRIPRGSGNEGRDLQEHFDTLGWDGLGFASVLSPAAAVGFPWVRRKSLAMISCVSVARSAESTEFHMEELEFFMELLVILVSSCYPGVPRSVQHKRAGSVFLPMGSCCLEVLREKGKAAVGFEKFLSDFPSGVEVSGAWL